MNKKEIIATIDHTLLKQAATWEQIRDLCIEGMESGTASVCIPPSFVKQAAEFVNGRLPICTVIGFPNGYQTTAIKAMEAAELLAADGISAAVVNISTIKPLDNALITEMAQKTGAVVTAEEHNIYGGLGSAVAEVLVETCPVPMARVGVEDKFGESGLPDELLEKYGLSASNIAAKAKAVIAKK